MKILYWKFLVIITFWLIRVSCEFLQKFYCILPVYFLFPRYNIMQLSFYLPDPTPSLGKTGLLQGCSPPPIHRNLEWGPQGDSLLPQLSNSACAVAFYFLFKILEWITFKNFSKHATSKKLLISFSYEKDIYLSFTERYISNGWGHHLLLLKKNLDDSALALQGGR